MARVGSDLNTAEEIPRLRDVFRDEREPIGNRVQAVRIFLITCEQEQLPLAALESEEELRAVWSSPSVEEAESLCLQLIFETIAADEHNILALAERLLEISKRLRSDLAANLRRNCGIAFLRGGATQRALDAWEAVYDDAVRLGLGQSQYTVALMLAHTNLDVGNDEACDHWRRAMLNQAAGLENSGAQFHLKVLEADLAFARRDSVAFQALSAWAQERKGEPASGRVRNWLRCVELYSSHLRGVSIGADRLASDAFLGMSPNLEPGGVRDLQVAVSIRLLGELGRNEAARMVANRYFAVFRRAKSPLNAPLKAALREVGSPQPSYGNETSW